MLSFQIVAPRWGGVARSRYTSNPGKNASPSDNYVAGLCSTLSNEARTRSENWHKFDTGGSLHVPPLQTKNAVQAGPLNGAKTDKKTGVFRGKEYHEASAPSRQTALAIQAAKAGDI